MAAHSYMSEDGNPHSPSIAREKPKDHNVADAALLKMAPPVHPIAAFQGAFEESIVDSAAFNPDSGSESDHDDAEMRRRKLLHAKRYEDIRDSKYKRRKGAKFHPFVKLVSQIVFGIHLLQQQQAKSNEQVVTILQNHVNEVDNLLERTSEDLDLAFRDIKERVRYLKLPTKHMDVFEGMLNEKKFRTDLLAGNEKIEMIIRRTSQAMNDSVHDIQSGGWAAKELAAYLRGVEKVWPTKNVEIGAVYAAMCGNLQGWMQFLDDLHHKSVKLNQELKSLNDVITEISQMARAASLRNKRQSRTATPPIPPRRKLPRTRSTLSREPHQRPSSRMDKPLPKEPAKAKNAIPYESQSTPLSTRYEQPRRQVPTPGPYNSSRSSDRTSHPKRNTAGGSAARTQHAVGIPSESARGLADITEKSANPLRSHPPENIVRSAPTKVTAQSRRSSSQSTANMLEPGNKKGRSESRRSIIQEDVSGSKQRRESEYIPRKPVGSTSRTSNPQQRGESITEQAPAGPYEKQELPSVTTGISRRLSTKDQTPSPPINYVSTRELMSRRVDSAYFSSAEKDSKRSNSSPYATDSEQEWRSRPSKSSGLGLFPKDMGPLTPSQAKQQRKDYFTPDHPAQNRSIDSTPQGRQPARPAKATRTLSFKNFFHRKGKSHG